MKSWKDNISFILVEPHDPGNIGASARALKNMGFTELELVQPRAFMTDEARWMACNAVDIIKKTRVHSRFKEAIRDKNLIVGTTRRLGKKRGLILPVRDGIKRIIKTARRNKVAILFGRERNGLHNTEVEECGFLLTIPSDPLSPSLNLAQSVLLLAYELSLKDYKTDYPDMVSHDELVKLFRHAEATLKLLEFIPRGDKDLEQKIMKNLKHLFGRSGLTDWECNMLHGICTQIEKKIKDSGYKR
jgi:TrmH family RNA methyltransferase